MKVRDVHTTEQLNKKGKRLIHLISGVAALSLTQQSTQCSSEDFLGSSFLFCVCALRPFYD